MQHQLYFLIRFSAFAKEYKFNVSATSIEEAISEIEKTHPIMPNEGKRNYYVESAYKLIKTENSNIFVKADIASKTYKDLISCISLY